MQMQTMCLVINLLNIGHHVFTVFLDLFTIFCLTEMDVECWILNVNGIIFAFLSIIWFSVGGFQVKSDSKHRQKVIKNLLRFKLFNNIIWSSRKLLLFFDIDLYCSDRPCPKGVGLHYPLNYYFLNIIFNQFSLCKKSWLIIHLKY